LTKCIGNFGEVKLQTGALDRRRGWSQWISRGLSTWLQ